MSARVLQKYKAGLLAPSQPAVLSASQQPGAMFAKHQKVQKQQQQRLPGNDQLLENHDTPAIPPLQSPTQWTTEKVEILCDEWQQRPELWNTKLTTYKNRTLRRIKLNEICQALGNTFTRDEIHRKMNNLRIYFNREHKATTIRRSGDGVEDSYESTWPFYESLLFLKDVLEPRESEDNLAEQLDNNDFKIENDVEDNLQDTGEKPTETAAEDLIDDTPDAQQDVLQHSQPDDVTICDTPQTQRPPAKRHSLGLAPPSRKKTPASVSSPGDQNKSAVLAQAFKVLSEPPASANDLFGQYIARSLDKMPAMLCEQTKLEIQQLLFKNMFPAATQTTTLQHAAPMQHYSTPPHQQQYLPPLQSYYPTQQQQQQQNYYPPQQQQQFASQPANVQHTSYAPRQSLQVQTAPPHEAFHSAASLNKSSPLPPASVRQRSDSEFSLASSHSSQLRDSSSASNVTGLSPLTYDSSESVIFHNMS